jgi:hypothetical protein
VSRCQASCRVLWVWPCATFWYEHQFPGAANRLPDLGRTGCGRWALVGPLLEPLLGYLFHSRLVTRSTLSSHADADYSLSARATMRILRRIAYLEADVFPAPTGMIPDEPWQSPLPFDAPGLHDGQEDGPDASPDTFTPSSGGSRIWYLNEVPAEWAEDIWTCDRKPAEIIDVTEDAGSMVQVVAGGGQAEPGIVAEGPVAGELVDAGRGNEDSYDDDDVSIWHGVFF